jgi:hypothetical protein
MSKSILFIAMILWCGRPSAEVEKLSLEFTSAVPLTGNAWFSNLSPDGQNKFGALGLENWFEAEKEVWIYFHTSEVGEINLGLTAKVSSGASEINVTLNGEDKNVQLNNTTKEIIPVGVFNVTKPGYQKVIVKGISKTGAVYCDLESLNLGGKAGAAAALHFVRDDFFWGRRGPSVHFSYTMPQNSEAEWIYNEITVPNNNDVLGSYFMANGFAEGYFGIQVNSATERRILFSVWSPYETDNPASIPEDQKIILLKKGADVITGEFGNEGSGGQSYKRFNWVAGKTYKFLTKIVPSPVTGSTDYSSYFYAPETGQWELIASFRRPHTTTYAKRFHSFLENFVTGTGHVKRGVEFSNQWIYTTSGEWIELTEARYTADATARKGNRLDYLATVTPCGRFYLSNCGFFSPNIAYDTMFKRKAENIKPDVNLDEIANL